MQPEVAVSHKNISHSLLDHFREYGIALALMLEIILFWWLSPYFLTTENLINVTLQVSITAIIAVGMTFVILTAGIDLSVGAVVALSGVITTGFLKQLNPSMFALPIAILAGVGVGAVAGFITGTCITRFRITPFIATLAIMTIARGIAFLYTDGRPIWELPTDFGVLRSGRLAGLPLPTLIMIILYLLAFVVLHQTRFGRYVYAVGGNKEAARLCGINVNAVIVRVYVLSGMLAAVSGILLSSRMNSGQPNAGQMYELDVIAAVVVGGTSLFGGRGTVVGTFLGAMLIGILHNGLNLRNVSSYMQMVVLGVVILVAVMLDQMKKQS